VVGDVCCLAELRQLLCRRGISHALTSTSLLQRQNVDDYDCQRLSHDDAKVRLERSSCDVVEANSLNPISQPHHSVLIDRP